MSPRRRGSADLGRAASRVRTPRSTYAVFYVVTEGQGTEYDYFDRLDKAYGPRCKFRIMMPLPHVRRNGLSPFDVIEQARLANVQEIEQAWGLFDHDDRDYIDQVCSTAKRTRVEVALSHPSFELWLLLHFQDFAPAAQGGKSKGIVDKLRDAHPAFADYDKRSKRIGQSRFSALMEGDGIRIRNAVCRARRLARHFDHKAPSQRDPSTEVYRLIEALGIVGSLS